MMEEEDEEVASGGTVGGRIVNCLYGLGGFRWRRTRSQPPPAYTQSSPT